MDTPPELLGFWDFSRTIILPRLGEGMMVTLELTLVSGALGILLGLLLACMRLSRFAPLRWPAVAHITFFRGTPLLLQILFVYFALPSLLDVRLDSKPSGILALSLNCAAYFAEIFRAAIESVSKGQMEAAWALGLSRAQAMRFIIIPQTYKRLIPPVVNELAALTKDTSLVSVVALPELLYITQRIGAKYLRPWETYVWAALGYLIVVMVLSGLAHKLESHLETKGGV